MRRGERHEVEGEMAGLALVDEGDGQEPTKRKAEPKKV